jgi:hypothetical protein
VDLAAVAAAVAMMAAVLAALAAAILVAAEAADRGRQTILRQQNRVCW